MTTDPAPTIRLSGEGRAVALAGDVNRFLVTGRETSGRYAQWEVTLPPGGGPMPHTHTREEEALFVLEGEVVLRVGEARAVARAGTFVGLPPGVPHWFKNESAWPARVLITAAPAGLEGFFFEAGTEIAPGCTTAPPTPPAEVERIRAAAPKYGIVIGTPGRAGGEA